MRVLAAFDKFKGSLTAAQACSQAVRTLKACRPDWEVDACPLTDGGEGFTEILSAAAHGEAAAFRVEGPRGGWVDARLGLVRAAAIPAAARAQLQFSDTTVGAGRMIAVLDAAAASGLDRLPTGQRDPWHTSTRGTGQLIRAAAELGAGGIILGIGGSATNDLGLGALGALGLEFRAADGGTIRPATPAQWNRIAAIEGAVFPQVPPIRIACDVANPLLGPDGAAATYGPQKGLRPEDRARMEAAMEQAARLLCAHCRRPFALAEAAGSGAAGGLSFGLLVAADARLVPGSGLVSAWLGLDARIAAADLVITGEGSFDASSLQGKGPGAIAARAAGAGREVHVFAGRISGTGAPEAWHLHAITPEGLPWDEARAEAAARLAASIRTVFGAGG